MKQPELGLKLNELRHQKSLTQKEVSDLCNVDVRTIQRIETGEVIPRISTLKLIAVVLDVDISDFNGQASKGNKIQVRNLLLVSFIAGIIYLVNFFFYMPGLIGNEFLPRTYLYLVLSVIHLVTSILLFNGFCIIGGLHKNSFLRIGSLIIMVIVPLMVISQHLVGSSGFHAAEHFATLFTLILGLNGVLFGIGLLRNTQNKKTLSNIAGILQLLICPLIVVPNPIFHFISFWLSMPLIFLLLLILFHEKRMLFKD